MLRYMNASLQIKASSGHTLVDLVIVLALVGICLTAGMVSLASGVGTQQARGAAQSAQAAAAWAQTDVLWHGGSVRVGYDAGAVDLTHDLDLCGASLGCAAPVADVSTNVARWRDGEAIAVTFTGDLASPDSGGSLYFDALQMRYRVMVRPESGLTARGFSVLP